MKTPITTRALRGVAATIAASALLLAGCGSTNPMAATGNAGAETRAKIEAALRDAMATDHLRAVIVRITANGEDVYTAALGESGDGVPATPDMRFRNGAFAFTYIGHAFARLADAGKVSLDDKLARWFPEMPRADLISLRNLLNMTSGYADYVYQPVISDTLMANPWKQWTDDELLAIGFAAPPMFAPGTNWAYSHTNYIILGKVLEKIGERPLEQVLQEHVIGPMGLTATSNNGRTPTIPEPILRSYSADARRPTTEVDLLGARRGRPRRARCRRPAIHDVTRSSGDRRLRHASLAGHVCAAGQAQPPRVRQQRPDRPVPALPEDDHRTVVRPRCSPDWSVDHADEELRRRRREQRLPAVEEARNLGCHNLQASRLQV